MSFDSNKKRDLFSRGGRSVSTPQPATMEPALKVPPVVTDNQASLPLNNQEVYLSVPEVAKIFGVAEATAYRWIYRGELQGTVIGRKRKVATSEVRRFSATYNQPGTKLK